MNKQHLLIAILVALVLAMGFCSYKSRAKRIQSERNYTALNDTLESTRNEMGQQTATIENLEVESKTQFLSLRSRDATVLRLQESVADYKGKLTAAIATTSVTSSSGVGSSTVVFDTLYTDTGMVVQEVYFRKWEGPWEDGWIEATSDSIYHKILIKDSMDVTIGNPRNWNPFKKSMPEITLESANPNVTITNLRSVTFKGGQRRIGVTMYAGYGLTADFSGKMHHGFQLGVGAGWRIYP